MELNTEEIRELLVVLNTALYDTEALIGQSHTAEEVDTYQDHREIFRKWISHLSQSMNSELDQDEQETFAED